MTRGPGRSVVLGVGIAFAILAALAVASYLSFSRLADGARWLDHTHLAMLKLEELYATLENGETGQRNYVISGDEQYLAPYRAAARVLPERMRALKEMTTDNPRQQLLMAALEPLVSSRLAVLAEGIDLKKAGGFDAATAVARLAQRKKTMDQIGEIVAEMKAEEGKLLQERARAVESERVNVILVLGFGNVIAAVCLLLAFRTLTREATERKEAEAAAQRRAEEIEDLYNNAPCGYYSLDKDGVFVRVNDTLLNWLGYTRDEVVGKIALPDMLTVGGGETYRQVFPLVQERGWARNVELDFLRKDGTILAASSSATVVMDDSGNFLRTRSTLFDITERREAERRLHEANAFLDSVFEHIPAMVFVKDAKDLTFVRHNKANQELLGYTEEQVIGKSDYDLFPREQAEFFVGKDRVVLTGKVVVDIPEEPIQTRDRGLRILHTRKIPVFDTGGHPLYLLGISEDITDRKLIEKQIKELNESLELRAVQLEATNKELESFSYSVSHDLRTPLRAIDGFSRILQEDYGDKLDGEGKRLLEVIRDNSGKMARLIEDLLSFSKLGRLTINIGDVDMSSLAQEVFLELSSGVDQVPAGVRLDPLPPARGDRTLLRQVWANLLSNAVKYSSTTQNASIEVTGHREGMDSVYCVKDNGVGFDMKYRDKLFGVFQRLHAAEEFPGTGVGLAIVQRIVTRHGGRAWAQGRLNEGAAFYFSLPNGAKNG